MAKCSSSTGTPVPRLVKMRLSASSIGRYPSSRERSGDGQRGRVYVDAGGDLDIGLAGILDDRDQDVLGIGAGAAAPVARA